jgi:hypothetical protein
VPQDTAKVKELLRIPPSLEVAALIPFGYMAEGAKELPQIEIALPERLHIDRF